MDMQGIQTISTVCGGCHNTCPMFVDVSEGRIVRARGVPGNKRTGGALCSKGLAAAQIAHDPRRVLYPMRRVGEKGSGAFERISWKTRSRCSPTASRARRPSMAPLPCSSSAGRPAAGAFPMT